VTRIYVAASSRELDRAERVMNELRKWGFEISHDWIPGVRDAMAAGIEEAKADDTFAFAAAFADLRGVADADVLVFLAPTATSKMAWAEFGYALALNIPCIVAHDDRDKRNQSIVTRLAHQHCEDACIRWAIEDVLKVTLGGAA
jgi:nucleoside 2-deoxyribosyltransferase